MLINQLDEWWDMTDPRGTRVRLERAMDGSDGDCALVLTTQIARTYGLEGEFERARDELTGVRDRIDGAAPEAQARFWLEWGRSFASTTHDLEEVTEEERLEANDAYVRAAEIAAGCGADDLQIDAVHMRALTAESAAERIRLTRVALALALASDQPEAQRWEASLRNNLGYELAERGEHAAAAVELERALAERRRRGDDDAVRIAEWMVAWNARLAGDHDRALQIQERLEREWAAVGTPDPYVWSELAALHQQLGDQAAAEHYRELTR